MNMTTTTTTTWNPPPPPPLNSLHPHILSALNHHLPGHHNASSHQVQVQQQPSTCSRWNPTAEQLLALEELYRRGMRTPTATQIQQIASRLRRFGKIEGKNVFYWFQNHKARERQKRRRLVDNNCTNNHQHNNHINSNNNTSKNLENQHDSVSMRREGYKVEQTRSRVRSLNCSKSSEVIQRNETWELSSSAICWNTSPPTVSVCKTKSHDVNEKVGDEETAGGDDQTLELFPVKGINARTQDTNRFPSRCTPNYQYIEFLPVKK